MSDNGDDDESCNFTPAWTWEIYQDEDEDEKEPSEDEIYVDEFEEESHGEMEEAEDAMIADRDVEAFEDHDDDDGC